jgi:hypothetical protein
VKLVNIANCLLQNFRDKKFSQYHTGIINIVRGLGKNDDKWFADIEGSPFLRVLAAWPADPGVPKFPYVHLNMNLCCEKMDRNNLLVNLMETFKVSPKRSTEAEQGDVKGCGKRQRNR